MKHDKKLCGLCKGLDGKRRGITATRADAPTAPLVSGCPIERSKAPRPTEDLAPAVSAREIVPAPTVSIEDCEHCAPLLERLKERAEKIRAKGQRNE